MPQVEFPADVHNAVTYLRNTGVDASVIPLAIYKMRELGYTKAADWVANHQDTYTEGVKNGDYKVGSAIKGTPVYTGGEITKPIDLTDLTEPPFKTPGIVMPEEKKADSKPTKSDH